MKKPRMLARPGQVPGDGWKPGGEEMDYQPASTAPL